MTTRRQFVLGAAALALLPKVAQAPSTLTAKACIRPGCSGALCFAPNTTAVECYLCRGAWSYRTVLDRGWTTLPQVPVPYGSIWPSGQRLMTPGEWRRLEFVGSPGFQEDGLA